MALLPILEFPDPRLRTVAKEVAIVDDQIRQLINDMLETMYDAPGIGLAATQVNMHVQIIVIDISENKDRPRVFINPSIEVLDSKLEPFEEGCLSVPGYSDQISRPRCVQVTALNEHGVQFTESLYDLMAVCLQHEMDHLRGKLFVDYLSPLKRHRLRRRLEKERRRLHGA